MKSSTLNNIENYGHVQFDAYMVSTDDLEIGQLRLLEASPVVWLPLGYTYRFLITSTDVSHSWAVPSLGVKVDACPGRLNQVYVTFMREGLFYGQCSELCGINHSFMPITIRVLAHTN